MLRILIVPLVIIYWTCQLSPPSWIIGEYKSKKIGKLESTWLLLNNTTYVLHSSLKLNSDNSYLYISCGNIIKGKWIFNNQTKLLLLFCEENNFRNDSLNRIKHPTCGTEPARYRVDDDGNLLNTYTIGSTKVLDILVKEKN